jgi:hypothetical protein
MPLPSFEARTYPVRLPDGELAIVTSIADALPALLDYYEKERRSSGAYAFLPLAS